MSSVAWIVVFSPSFTVAEVNVLFGDTFFEGVFSWFENIAALVKSGTRELSDIISKQFCWGHTCFLCIVCG